MNFKQNNIVRKLLWETLPTCIKYNTLMFNWAQAFSRLRPGLSRFYYLSVHWCNSSQSKQCKKLVCIFILFLINVTCVCMHFIIIIFFFLRRKYICLRVRTNSIYYHESIICMWNDGTDRYYIVYCQHIRTAYIIIIIAVVYFI